LIIIALIPLALRGVKYRPVAPRDSDAQSFYLRLRGVIIPFIASRLSTS